MPRAPFRDVKCQHTESLKLEEGDRRVESASLFTQRLRRGSKLLHKRRVLLGCLIHDCHRLIHLVEGAALVLRRFRYRGSDRRDVGNRVC